MEFIKKYWPFIIVITIVTTLLLNNILQCVNESNKFYNFKISAIEEMPTKSLVLYNKHQKIVLWNFVIASDLGVKVGDVIYKEKCSNVLYVRRKNTTTGKYEEFLKIKFSGMIPYKWICER